MDENITHKQLVSSGLVKRTYNITIKQARGLEAMKESGRPASVALRFALEEYLNKNLGDSYV